MTFRDDSWRDSYDAWKLATPPEYEITAEEEQELFEREQEEREAAEKEARELREFDDWEARWPWRKWRIYWRVRNRLLRFWHRWTPLVRYRHWKFARELARNDEEIPF